MVNKVIVFGGNHHNTLGVLRAIGQKGLLSELIVVGPDVLKDTYVALSKYITTSYAFVSYEDAYDFVVSNYEKEKKKPVIICTSDSASSIVDTHYDELKDKFYIPNAKRTGRITRFMDKETMRLTAESIGLKTPKSWLITPESSLEEIVYPCITKPIKSIKGSKDDIQICQNRGDLVSYLNTCKEDTKIQVQVFINCDFEYQLIGCSLDGGDKVIIPGVSKIIRPAKNTNTGFLHYERLNKSYPLDKCVKFLKGIGYSGLFSIEFLRGKDGTDYFMEINMRNDGNAICVTAAGVNLPYLWYAYNTEKDISSIISSKINEIYVMPEFDEFMAVLKGNINPFTWIRDVFRTDCFMEYDKADTKPFKKRLKQIMGLLTKKIFRCG